MVRWFMRGMLILSIIGSPLTVWAQEARAEPCDDNKGADALGKLLDQFDPLSPISNELLYPDEPLHMGALFGGASVVWQAKGKRYTLDSKGKHTAFLQPYATNMTSEQTAVEMTQELLRRALSDGKLMTFVVKLPSEPASEPDGWFVRRYPEQGGLVVYKLGGIGKPIIEQSVSEKGSLGPRRLLTYNQLGLVTRVVTHFQDREGVQNYEYYPNGTMRTARMQNAAGEVTVLHFNPDGSVVK